MRILCVSSPCRTVCGNSRSVESYKISMKEDEQLQKALDLFDKFTSLDDMFKYAIEQNKSEQNSLNKR